MPALLTRTSMVPKAAMKSANIFFTAALLETSATKGRALPPARSISVTTLCADSGRTSLTPIFAPSRAKVSPISRPSPEPPPVIKTILFLSFIDSSPSNVFGRARRRADGGAGSGFGFSFLELAFPVQAARLGSGSLRFGDHPFLLVEHAEVSPRQDVFLVALDMLAGQRDRTVEIALGLVAHGEAVDRIDVIWVNHERLLIDSDRLVVLVVGEQIDRLVVKFFLVGHR